MKLMIMNYKPYEYELLMEKLNKLGQQGYKTNELEFITFFKKVDYPVYYDIDFHKTVGSNKRERQKDKDAFAQKYRQRGMQPIYAKNNMFVFTSKEPKEISINWKEKTDITSGPFKWISLLCFFISVVALAMFSQYLMTATFDKFMSYGISFVYIGVVLFFLTVAFRSYLHFHNTGTFYHKIKNQNPHMPLKAFKIERIIYSIAALLTAILIFGGLIEDTLNQHSFDPQQHAIIQLSDFDIHKETTLSTQAYSSFTLPHTYISLEEVNDGNEALYIKEFTFTSQEKAQETFPQILDMNQLYAGNRAEMKDSVIYGYYDDELVSVVLLHDQSITLIIPTFELTTDYINTILQFYQ